MRRRPVTAADLVTRLDADPEYQASRRKREAELTTIWEQRRQDESALVRELRESGFQIGSVYDLVNTAAEYRDALPVLVRHLDVSHTGYIREGIIRALTVKYGGLEVEAGLLRQFYAEQDDDIRWALANALKVAMPLIRRKKHPEIKSVYERSKRPNKSPETNALPGQ
jgi:hypothetical protein